MYDHIVIPVDGSDEATRAAKHGLKLAQVFDATADILHVIERKSLQLARTSNEKVRLRERGEAVLAEIEELASELGQPVTTTLTEGKPAARIREHATDQNATLIVIGRQGLTGLGKRLLGSVTEQVLHRSDIPVLVVPHGTRTTERETDYSRVLIPTDGSDHAETAIPHGVTIAQHYGAVLHVLNVVDLQAAGGPFDVGGLEKEFVDRLEARGKDAVERIATTIEETAPGLNVTTAITRTPSFQGIATGIHQYRRDNDIDLIVMGAHGRSKLKRQLLGSVTATLLRRADVPILVVK